MLELKGIKKDYKLKDQDPVHALKGIDLQFRESEFVAILGPSGCGKTTLLNITGGLDHYDDGDLIIKGKSTKDFTDRDWDTYRNHSVGFVFQSYNLISHQSVIKNVELALTITGLKKEERVKRAKTALDTVGLHDLYFKKPNQMSGGQMQRVAIARALVNNPEIVLADEPTGALDSETSVQIMDLLKEVSKNHLVIMVTHNPELAEQYATRIVRMKDGNLISDSNPFSEAYPIKDKIDKQPSGKKHSSMGFFTAMGLSLSNLITKLNRTILVAVAGSIGIIGVSSILGVSCGVKGFINDMENDMLSSYPIAVNEETIDTSSLLTGLSNSDKTKIAEFDASTRVGLDSMISYMMQKYTDFTNIKTNEITDELVEYISEMPSSYYSSINYNYSIDPTNNFFTAFKKDKQTDSEIFSVNGLTAQYTKTLMTVKGFENYASFVDIFTNFMSQIPGDESYIMSQYDLVAGTGFPNKENELALVIDKKSTMTDLVLAQLGYYDQKTFLNIAKKAVKSNELQKKYLNDEITKQEYEQELAKLDEKYVYETSFTYEELLNHELYYFPHSQIYQPDPSFVSHKGVTISLSGQLSIPGNPLTFILGLNYVNDDDALLGTLIVLDSSNNIVLNQSLILSRDTDYVVTNPDPSVADGKWGITYDGQTIELIINSADKTVGSEETTFNATGSLKIPYNGFPLNINLTSGKIKETEPTTKDYWYDATIDRSSDMLENPENYGGFKVKISAILRPKSNTNFGSLNRGVYFSKAFTEKYMEDSANSPIFNEFKNHIENEHFNESTFHAYVKFKYDDYSDDDGSQGYTPKIKSGYASSLNGSTANALTSIFASFITSGKSNLDIDKSHLRSLCGYKVNETEIPVNSAIVNKTSLTPNDNKTKTVYSIIRTPQSISIYPKDFNTKNSVVSYLERWNSNTSITINDPHDPTSTVTLKKEDRKEITITDTISIIVTTISSFVDYVSIALIAFTSLSLVVSCFMIAVITFISVMERIKEIGVIRSLGGRKKDVSRLFIAENLITGLASGVLGICITYVLQLALNAVVSPMGVTKICALPWYYALMMIGISILLSVLSGLIPSFKASKQDPVIALRSE